MHGLTSSDSSALFSETLNAGALLEHGIAAFERSHMASEAEFVPLVLLAAGLERLCKVTLAVKGLRDDSRLRTKDLKKLRHDVAKLVDRVASECFTPDYLTFEAPRADHTFLTSDQHLRNLLRLITKYGVDDGRYHLLNLIGGDEAPDEDPHVAWLAWDRSLLASNPELIRMAESVGGYETYYAISVERRRILEMLLRAVCRLYCPMVLDARNVCAPPLIRWAELPDSQLGVCDYNLLTRRRYDPFHGVRKDGAVGYQAVSLATFPSVSA
jgi:hypothetical protein